MRNVELINDIKAMCIEAEKLLENDFFKAQYLTEEAYLRANDINYEEGICSCLLLFGVLKYIKGEFSLANEYYESCLQSCKNNGFLDIEIKTLKSLGDLRYRVNDYDSALEYYLNCLDIVTTSYKNVDEKIDVIRSLGTIYMELEQYNIAIEYFKEAVYLINENDSNQILSRLYTSISKCYIEQGELDLAKEYILSSINMAIEISNDYDIGFAYMVYAKYYYENKDFEEAGYFYKKAIHKLESINDINLLAETMAELGIMLFEQGNYTKSEKILDETSMLLLNEKNYKIELKVYLYLGRIFEIIGEYRKALSYYKRFNEMKTVNDETWKTIKVKNIINKYEHLRTNIKVKELKNTNHNLVVFSGLGREITSILDFSEIIGKISASIFDLINCELFGIGFINDSDRMSYTIDNGDGYKKSIVSLKNKADYLAGLIEEGKEFVDNDFNLNTTNGLVVIADEYGFKGVRSIMSCPLIFQNRIIGIVNVKSYVVDAFNNNDFEILKILSSYISIALHNSMQSQKLIDTNSKLKELTEKDGLTKVYNRYALNANIKRILRRAKKFNKPYSVIMIDVDFFKEYNDNYGHLAGDQCLVNVSSVLKKVCGKEKSYIYRYGGDEFLVILLNVSAEESHQIGEKIRAGIRNLQMEHLYSKCNKVITLTLGIATIIHEIKDHERVFALADKALYVAKNRGRDNVNQIIHD